MFASGRAIANAQKHLRVAQDFTSDGLRVKSKTDEVDGTQNPRPSTQCAVCTEKLMDLRKIARRTEFKLTFIHCSLLGSPHYN